MIFTATAVTDPDSHVCPEAANCVNVAPLQLDDLHCVYIPQPLGVDLKDSERFGPLGDFVLKLDILMFSKPDRRHPVTSFFV